MTAILRQLPFFEWEDEVHVGRQRVAIKPYQIIVWVSLTARGRPELPPHAPRFPAILDTAHSHNFSIQKNHLTQWARVEEVALTPRGRIRESGEYFPLVRADGWLHPNRPGRRDEFSGTPPFRLTLKQGIVLYPSSSDFPRLPLLGLRALVRNKLCFAMDSERCLVNLRTPDWRTKLLHWLS
jgi:hypothetical protein